MDNINKFFNSVFSFIKKYSTLLLLLLIIITLVVLLGLFLPKTEGSVYGNRLDGIEDVPLTGDVKSSILDAITSTEKTTSSNIALTGKIIKINIKVKDDVSLEDAKKIYDSFKSKFTEQILAYYDIQIMLVSKDYSAFGYLKAGRPELKWTNNK